MHLKELRSRYGQMGYLHDLCGPVQVYIAFCASFGDPDFQELPAVDVIRFMTEDYGDLHREDQPRAR